MTRRSPFPALLLASLGLLASAAPAQTPGAAPDCMATASTQQQLNACAAQGFEVAQARNAATYRRLSQSLGNAQRQRLRQAQDAWTDYRKKACEFERQQLGGGSVAPMVHAQCQTRLTLARTAELERPLRCEEGDVGCVRPGK